jgi:hypothetical protein
MTIRAEELKVLEPVVEAVSVDVVKLQRQRLFAPLGQAAAFSP